MKKLLLLLVVFTSCKKEVYYYPSEDFFKKNNPKEINIDDLSFEKVTDSIRNGLYEKKFHFLELEDSKAIYKVSPSAVTGGYVLMRNSLYIINDSLDVWNGKFHVNELSKYLKLHYENNNKVYYYAQSYKRAHIMLVLEKQENSEKLKNVLLNLVKTYNQTEIENKDSISFNIVLDYPFIKPLPPPKPIPFY